MPCSSYRDGKACKSDLYVKRSALEDNVLGPIRRDMLSPSEIALMAKHIERLYVERLRARTDRAADMPRELVELDARIQRLRDRLKGGDTDLTPDEIQGAIEKALEKRRQLEAVQPLAKQSAVILTALPKAATLYRQQIEKGLDGDVRAPAKARVILRQLFVGGSITLRPGPDRSLWAEYQIRPKSLVFQAIGAEWNQMVGGPALISLRPSRP